MRRLAPVCLSTREWEEFMTRIGRWADQDHGYATLDDNYIESVWWVTKQLHEKGLVYRGFRSNPYCPRCATPLSNFEVNQNYKDNVPDPSVYVKFEVARARGLVAVGLDHHALDAAGQCRAGGGSRR
jgi:isoleucyl-tRNA synthetase